MSPYAPLPPGSAEPGAARLLSGGAGSARHLVTRYGLTRHPAPVGERALQPRSTRWPANLPGLVLGGLGRAWHAPIPGRDANQLLAACRAWAEIAACNESLPPITGPHCQISLGTAW